MWFYIDLIEVGHTILRRWRLRLIFDLLFDPCLTLPGTYGTIPQSWDATGTPIVLYSTRILHKVFSHQFDKNSLRQVRTDFTDRWPYYLYPVFSRTFSPSDQYSIIVNRPTLYYFRTSRFLYLSSSVENFSLESISDSPPTLFLSPRSFLPSSREDFSTWSLETGLSWGYDTRREDEEYRQYLKSL